jgi:hypothetical protein
MRSLNSWAGHASTRKADITLILTTPTKPSLMLRHQAPPRLGVRMLTTRGDGLQAGGTLRVTPG